MPNQFSRTGNYAINWDNVLYVKRTEQDSGGYAFHVYFVGKEKLLMFDSIDPESEALLDAIPNFV